MAYEAFAVVVIVVQVVVVVEARTRPSKFACRVFVLGVVSLVDVLEVSLLSDGKAFHAVGKAAATRIEVVLVVAVRVRAGTGLEGFGRTGGIRRGTLPEILGNNRVPEVVLLGNHQGGSRDAGKADGMPLLLMLLLFCGRKRRRNQDRLTIDKKRVRRRRRRMFSKRRILKGFIEVTIRAGR